MAVEFDYDELIRLVEAAPPANVLVCRGRESAEALLCWIVENFPEDFGWLNTISTYDSTECR